MHLCQRSLRLDVVYIFNNGHSVGCRGSSRPKFWVWGTTLDEEALAGLIFPNIWWRVVAGPRRCHIMGEEALVALIFAKYLVVDGGRATALAYYGWNTVTFRI